MSNEALLAAMRALASGDRTGAELLFGQHRDLPTMALTRSPGRGGPRSEMFLDVLTHQVYEGDTLLHIAAASYAPALVQDLVARGAAVAAANRRGAHPLHYAVDGGPGLARWDPGAQRQTVACLIELGADPNAPDKSGTTPLLRAVRNRCADAVAQLLELGADVHATNHHGSTAEHLARVTSGRGGTGSPAAKAEQARIIELLAAAR